MFMPNRYEIRNNLSQVVRISYFVFIQKRATFHVQFP